MSLSLPRRSTNKNTIFDLRYQAATDMKYNQDLIDKRKGEAADGPWVPHPPRSEAAPPPSAQ